MKLHLTMLERSTYAMVSPVLHQSIKFAVGTCLSHQYIQWNIALYWELPVIFSNFLSQSFTWPWWWLFNRHIEHNAHTWSFLLHVNSKLHQIQKERSLIYQHWSNRTTKWKQYEWYGREQVIMMQKRRKERWRETITGKCRIQKKSKMLNDHHCSKLVNWCINKHTLRVSRERRDERSNLKSARLTY